MALARGVPIPPEYDSPWQVEEEFVRLIRGEIEEPSFNPFSFLQLLKNPLRWLFGKPALTCTADDH